MRYSQIARWHRRYVRITCNLESQRPFNISIDIRQRKGVRSWRVVRVEICNSEECWVRLWAIVIYVDSPTQQLRYVNRTGCWAQRISLKMNVVRRKVITVESSVLYQRVDVTDLVVL